VPPDGPVLSVAELLLRHAATRGRQIAFSDSRRNVSFADLERRTARIAGHLAGLGVAPGDRVAIALDSRVEAVESTFAITRAGAVGVPLDPRSSVAELAWALADSGARLVFTDGQRLGRLRAAATAATTMVLAEAVAPEGCLRHEDLAERDAARPAADGLSPDEPAWLHYTSGTTGGRKGVLSCQRAWLWSAASYATALGISSRDRLLWPLPLFHAFGHSLCVIGTLAVGASAHLPGDESLLDSLHSTPVTMLAGVPTTYRELIGAARADTRPLPRLRACITAGAPVPAQLNAEATELLGVPLLNQYGSTETCGAIATSRPGDPYVEGSCGPPVPGIDVRLVDPVSRTDVPRDEEGEIWVRGPGLMLGYRGDPETPFADGWYRTGDLGRRSESGRLTVTGRVKELIIRGGENIHPAEVERVLLACPGVADAVVTGIPHDVFGEVPAAFVVPGPEAPDPRVLLAACRAALPDYKVPAAFYELDAVPRTRLGKPRRHEASSRTERPLRARLAAGSAIDQLVLTETAAASGLPPGHSLDPGQPFTAWGMTSLVGVVLRDRLAALTGLELPATLIFDHPTPAAVARHLGGRLFGQPEPHEETPAGRPAGDDPIAIVAMACRYPGGIASPEDLWRVVSEERDVTSDFPDDRDWDLENLYDPDPDAPGTSTARRGGFLRGEADFDAGLFGISPREALATDPQQRLLLETAWELAERAGISPDSLRGTDTGVFTGIMYNDYAGRLGAGHELVAQLSMGSAASVAAGRISYTLGLHGPSLSLDTACSSSLVAMHLAAGSLRAGECSLAIAGGVTVMASPKPFVMFSKLRGLSPDGRCRSYSADADGTAWAEGVGLLLLERLSDARRHGHRVLALLSGTAVNSDGASNGLAAPSGPAQQQVIRQALAQAGLATGDVDVVEGHGTATQLGDPIEVQALLATYGQDRQVPLLLGSMKSNIGHAQAAAGVAGVIKMIQAIGHGIAPRTLNVSEPSRSVDWSAGKIELLTEARPWPPVGRPRRAAVSSFGIGGTNAHVILEQPPRPEPNPGGRRTRLSCPWLLSGADEAALRAQARALAARTGGNRADVAFSLATTRSALAYRAAVPAGDFAALAALADGVPHPDVITGVAGPVRLAMLFSGQGSQRPGMGAELRAAFPAFDAAFRAVCDELDPRLERPLSDVISSGGDLLDRTDFAQAAIFAFEVAMFRLLETFGLRPDRVAGHSIGEVTAAHVAGVLTLPDAAALVAARGALMSALPRGGAMAGISATEEELAEALAGTPAAVIAAVNAPRSVVVSGDEKAVTEVMATFADRGRRVTRLRVSHAFHSPLMDPVLADLGAALTELSFHVPRIPLVSTVSGKLADAGQLRSPQYWVQQVRAPVRFADAVRTLGDTGASVFAEVGPSAVLTPLVDGAVATGGDVNTLLGALGQLYVRGAGVGWKTVFAGSGARVVELPVYPFQRRRYWLSPSAPLAASPAPGGRLGHPLLSQADPVPGTGQLVCSGHLSVNAQPWLADHAMGGQVLLPATAFAELALRAGDEAGCGTLEELAIVAPLTVPSAEGTRVQVALGETDDQGGRSVGIYSRPDDAPSHEEWARHATGTLRPSAPRPGTRRAVAGASWPPARATPVDISGAYESLASAGIGYGPAFRCVRAVWRADGGLYADLQLPDSENAGGFILHPALLDAALQVPLVAAPERRDIRLPFILGGMRVFAPGARRLRARVREFPDGRMSLTLTDPAGAPVADLDSVTTRAWRGDDGTGDLYRLEWTAAPGRAQVATADDVLVTVPGAARGPDVIGAVHDATAETLGLLQKWSADQAHTGGRLVIVTENATGPAPDLAAAAVWGLVRSAQAEFPDRIVLADLDGAGESAGALPTALASGQTLLAVRAGMVMVPRLSPVSRGKEGIIDAGVIDAGAIDTGGTVLVTGGTGGLGALLSRHLATRYGAPHLLLISRSGDDAPGARQLRDDLASAGTEVRIVACDVADREKLAQIVTSASPPVSAVIHAAGVVDDAVLDALTPRRLADVLRPKADAAWHLHDLLPRVGSFVLFSSAAGMLGNRGQASYAAGNSFLDALARFRAARGLPAVSLAWGPWQNEAGLAGGSARGGRLMPLTDQQGLDLFDSALGTREPVLAALLVRGNAGVLPLTAAVKPGGPGPSQASDEAGNWRLRLASMPPAERGAALLDLVRGEVGAVLGYDTVPDRPLHELGFDSFTGVLLRNRLAVLTGLRLPGTLVFDRPGVPELTDHLLGQLSGDLLAPVPEAEPEPAPRPALRLASLYQRICEQGRPAAAAHLLINASLALPAFGPDAGRRHPPLPERLATGPARAALVCFPDFFPRIGASVYGKLADLFEGERDVFELPYPDAAVPDDFRTLAGLHAATILERFRDRPVVLIGYSAGGCTAQAVAECLAAAGSPPAGVVLIDTYLFSGNDPDWLFSLPAAAVSRAGARFDQVVDDTALAAMGAYLRIAAGWRPKATGIPALFLRAQAPVPGMPSGAGWRASWSLADRTVDIPGNHLELLDEQAQTTAAAIGSWLDGSPHAR
jgi:acyl transferase domain-containing protein/acyl-CoA synthetase (AMP-forming)/AMP-acid ligase II/thioesterase domain-containing protein